MCRPSDKVCNHKVDCMIMRFSGIVSSAVKDSSVKSLPQVDIAYDRNFQWKICHVRDMCKVSN